MKSKILQELSEKGIEILNEHEAKQVLEEYGIPYPKQVMVEYKEGKKGEDYLSDLKSKGDCPGYPAYLKIVSRDITSKTNAGAIRRVTSDEEATDTIDAIIRNTKRYKEGVKIQGILMSEDVSTNETREIFLGSTVNEQFGHVISLGFGGIYVEIYKDVEFRIIPIKESDVYRMIDALKGKEMLGKFRGMRPVNMDLLVKTTLKLSKMIEENPEIIELDVNPLLVGPDRVVAVDALIRIPG
ncbi:MAG: acetate--CoA ligase family protein [Candidatus Hadarchaeaceae archaeon]